MRRIYFIILYFSIKEARAKLPVSGNWFAIQSPEQRWFSATDNRAENFGLRFRYREAVTKALIL